MTTHPPSARLMLDQAVRARKPRRPPPSHLGWAMLALVFPPTGIPALRRALDARAAIANSNHNLARIHAARARQWSLYSAAAAFSAAFAASTVLFLTANNNAVVDKFFNGRVLSGSIPQISRGFLLNIELFTITEVLVLGWGLAVALVRLVPGRPALPLRLISVAYVDLFRGAPAVIVVYLIVFGLPLADLPLLNLLNPFELCTLALTLVYGAYVAEVYRAGVESIHWSQAAAARSLGLSYLQTLRHVIVPQAVRRVIPPLLNDFISLQKDTSLVGFVGLLDGFNRARIVASNQFNLSAVTGIGLAFVLITIPLTRGVDLLVRRDRRRSQAVT